MTKRVGRHLTKRTLSLEEFWEQEKDDLFKDIIPKVPKSSGNSDPAIQTLNDINTFFKKHKHEPKLSGPLEEKLLARKLSSIRNLTARKDLQEADTLGLLLLNVSSEEFVKVENKFLPQIDTSSDDTLADSLLDMLGGDKLHGLFDTGSLKKAKPKNTQDRVGHRTPCTDFTQYIPIFNQIKDTIDNNSNAILPFRGTSKISVGTVFIWGGITCFVEREVKIEYDPQGKPNPRLRIIFDNGMYADLLYQSFSQGMYRSPGTRRVSIDILNSLSNSSESLEERYGHKTGEIYFLASHSTNSEVTKYKNLIKVGVTKNSTPLRTRNADSESTYLYSPIRILRILPCYNINVQGLESLIHTQLNEFRKEIKFRHKKTGKELLAREWFDVELAHAVSIAISLVRDNIAEVILDENDNLYAEPKV